MKNDFSKPLTSKEVAEITRTSKADVVAELEAGRMLGFKIGNEWRILKDNLRAFMAGETNFSHKKGEETMLDNLTEVQWQKIDSFVYTWPAGTKENYDLAFKTNIELQSGQHDFIVGYTYRDVAGMKDRRRVVVFLGDGRVMKPVVEFAGANDFAETRRLVSVIKGRNGRHIRSKWQLPHEYVEMPTKIYSEVVIGPYAASGLAVIADDNDRNTMLRHAVIRARYKGWIQC